VRALAARRTTVLCTVRFPLAVPSALANEQNAGALLAQGDNKVAEIEVKGKGGTIIKVRSAALGGAVLSIYTGEGEASAPAIWLENEQAQEELIAAIKQAHEEQE